MTGETLSWVDGRKNNWGDACNSVHRVSGCPMVLEFLEFFAFFWIFFGTGNVLEKNPLFQACSGIALEFRIFHNQRFRLQHFGLPLFGSPI